MTTHAYHRSVTILCNKTILDNKNNTTDDKKMENMGI